MMTKPLIHFTTLAAALAFASCSSREPDVGTAWDNINLPTAAHFESLDCPGAGAFSLTIDNTGQMSLHGAGITESNLVRLARTRFQRYGCFSTVLFADSETTFESFWTPVQKLMEIGLWRFTFAATKKQTDESHVIGGASVCVPGKKNDPNYKGPVILETEGEEKGIILTVRFPPAGLKLNGKATSHQRLDHHFGEHAASLKMASIVLLPSPETQYSDIISVLDICSKHGLKNICIMENLDTQPTDPPYPQLAPANEAVSI